MMVNNQNVPYPQQSVPAAPYAPANYSNAPANVPNNSINMNMQSNMKNAKPKIGVLTPPNPNEVISTDPYATAEPTKLPPVKKKGSALPNVVFTCKVAVAAIALGFTIKCLPKIRDVFKGFINFIKR